MRTWATDRGRRRLRIAAVSAVVLVAATAGGRALLGTASLRRSSSSAVSRVVSHGKTQAPPSRAQPLEGLNVGTGKGVSSGVRSTSGKGSAPTVGTPAPSAHAGTSQASSPATTVPTGPVEPVGPDVVRTATIDLQVGKGTIANRMSTIAGIATTDGGYVDSSSMSGGSARSEPVTGQLVLRVPDTYFDGLLTHLATLGKVSSQQVSGQDVTGQVAEDAATISVLQEEVDLLQGKLSQTTDIESFLQIEGQLSPVQQQLQQLESQQTVLQGSVALATVTVDLTAPGAPAPVTPQSRPQTSALHTAWHYASHNTLVVLDGLAVAIGWALPLLALAGLGWLVVTLLQRRRRPEATAR